MNKKLQREEGFGLVELLIALTILNIAIFALLATLNAGALSLRRASRISTAETLADKQMELYRSVLYKDVGLSSTLVSGVDSKHTGDSSWTASQVAAASCTTALARCM